MIIYYDLIIYISHALFLFIHAYPGFVPQTTYDIYPQIII